MGKVSVTINSRIYTVMAQESDDYIRSLAEHINEKIETVLTGGTNVMGERPLILAALNICDEYFKVNEAGYTVNEQLKLCNQKLAAQTEDNLRLKKELEELKNVPQQMSFGDNSSDDLAKQLTDAQNKIVFLEGQIKVMEEKVRTQQKDFAAREREMLELINNR